MIDFEVKQVCAVLGEKKDKRGQMCEVRLTRIVWQGSRPMWDLRIWDGDKPLKGLTMTGAMVRQLKKTLDGLTVLDDAENA